MIRLSYLLLLIASSHGQQNTTKIENSTLDSVLVDLVLSAKQANVANETLKEIVTITPNTQRENERVTIAPETQHENQTTETVTNSDAVTEQWSCASLLVEDGTCVPYYKCNDSSSYADNDSYGIIDLHFGIETGCSSYLDVCCSPADIVQDTPTVVPAVIGNRVNKSCGHRNPDGVGLKLPAAANGDSSNFGEFPWTVAVLKDELVSEKEPEGQKYNICLGGGTLVHPSVVLTAGHVVNKDPKLRIRAGEWDTQTEREMYPHQERGVKEVVLHPEFNTKNLHNDIALLFLSDPVDISPPHIGVACLPNPNLENTVPGTQCFASGWGKDKFGKDGRYSVILKKVELPLVNHDTCQQRLRTTRLGTRFQLDSSFMCAGGEVGKDTCIGDGGAPLVCPVKENEERYVQNGIVAWGIGCGAEGVPGVYVNVANFRSWIDENVARHGFDPNTYTI